jgi:excinuclease ABC subunit C
VSTLSEKVHNLPPVPGVYLFKDARGEVLYVGKAKSLASRVRGYLSGESPEARLRELMARATDLDTIATTTEVEALLLEATLIRQHNPHYNVMLKDDKSFPYVRLSVQEQFPRLSITRQVRDDGARYVGPFVDVKRLRRTLREIRRIFPVRTCRNFEDYVRSNRPCLYYHIKRCAGPCTTRAHVDPQEYRALVDGLLMFLTGRDDDLLRRLRNQMVEAAEARNYEIAARRRDQLALLERARVPQQVVALSGTETDVLGLARHGTHVAVVALLLREGRVVGKETRILDRAAALGDAEALQAFLTLHYLARARAPRRIVAALAPSDAEVTLEALSRHAGHPVELRVPERGRDRRLVATAERNAALALEDLAARAAGRRARFSPEVLELQKLLALPTPPYRMVCFDISNFGPEGAVAAVVASENGRARTSLYRHMRIRTPGPDDFAMIAEAVERYWTRVESGEEPRPDLVMVDGGAGQVGAARAALDRVSTRPVPLIGLAKREETVFRERGGPLSLPRRDAGLRALQRLRDEAHRFGLTYHRKLRGRARISSALDRIPGVGPARRAVLLKEFGSIAALATASVDQIVERAHLPRVLAERVVRTLQSSGGGESTRAPERLEHGAADDGSAGADKDPLRRPA